MLQTLLEGPFSNSICFPADTPPQSLLSAEYSRRYIPRLISSVSAKKLQAKKKYYVRIRAFKKVKGKKYYSEWSKVKSKKVK